MVDENSLSSSEIYINIFSLNIYYSQPSHKICNRFFRLFVCKARQSELKNAPNKFVGNSKFSETLKLSPLWLLLVIILVCNRPVLQTMNLKV